MKLANLHLVKHIKTKTCTKCKLDLPIEKFSISKSLGLARRCKDCVNKIQNEYRKRNYYKVRENERKYQKSKRQDFHTRINALLNVSKQRARNKNREHTLTLNDLKEIFPKDNKCPIFGFEFEWNSAGFRETSPSIDRIDSSIGYTKDNIQIISWKANRIKSYATIEELETVINYMKSGG